MQMRVNYAELEAAAAQIGAARDDIQARLTQLEMQIQQLLSSGFVTAVASGKFATAYTNYSSSARNIVEQLLQIQGFLRSTAQTLQETDAHLAARIG